MAAGRLRTVEREAVGSRRPREFRKPSQPAAVAAGGLTICRAKQDACDLAAVVQNGSARIAVSGRGR